MIVAKRLEEITPEGSKVLTIGLDTTVLAAAKKMRYHKVGCLVVTENGGKPVGIVTEHDLVYKVIAGQMPPESAHVAEVMTKELISVDLNTSLMKAQEIMARHRIRHLPIIEDGLLMGIISSRDILAHQFAAVKAVITQQAKVLQQLKDEYLGIVD
jgi:CBS domain-containing protein